MSDPDWQSYERYAIDHHRNKTGHETWHWPWCGDDVLLASGFVDDINKARVMRCEQKPRQEYGLDGIARDGDGVYHGIQVKLRQAGSLTAKALATFMNVITFRFSRKNPASRGYLYSTAALQVDVKEDMDRSGLFVHESLGFPMEPPPKSPRWQLRPYQTAALEALERGWSGIGSLVMPCGTGKTNVAAMHSALYSKTIWLSPLRLSARQNYDRVSQTLGPGWTSLLVDSDGGEATRDVECIKTAWATGDHVFISATNASALDVLREAVLDTPPDDTCLIVVDEAHNMNGAMFDLIRDCSRVLLCTATPIASLAEADDDDNVDDSSTVDSVTAAWRDSVRPLFTYSFADAIRDKWITDYEIRLPMIEGNRSDEIGMQARFVLDGMVRTGSRRMIVYCSSHHECDTFLAAAERIGHDFHGLTDLWTGRVTCDTSSKNRCAVLDEFQGGSDERYYIVAAIRILDEAVDLPRCDSVCVLHPSRDVHGWRRMVQRAMRAVRLDPLKPHKIARVLLWSVDGDDGDIPKCLRVLREYDPDFAKKVMRQSMSRYTGGTEELGRETNATVVSQRDYAVRCLTVAEIKNIKIARLVAYMEEHGKRPRFTLSLQDGFGIGKFSQRLRATRGVNLTKDQRQQMLDVDPTFFTVVQRVSDISKELSKDEKIERVVAHIRQHGKRPPPSLVMEGGLKIGTFSANLRFGTKLTEKQRHRLLDVDSTFFNISNRVSDIAKELSMDEKVDRIVKHIRQHGQRPPQSLVMEDGFRIGTLVNGLRLGTKLTEDQRQRLCDVDPTFFTVVHRASDISKELSTDEKIDRVVEHIRQHGKRPPQSLVMEDGYRIGRFVVNMRSGTGTKLTVEQRHRLSNVDRTFFTIKPVSDTAKELSMDEKVDRVVKHIRQHDQRPPQSLVMEDGFRIGRYASCMRSLTELTGAQRQRLLDADPTFFTVQRVSDISKELTTDEKIKRVVEHIQQHGKRPPHSLVMEDGFKLGTFVASLRSGTKLTEEQRQQMLDGDPTFFDASTRVSDIAKELSRDEKIHRVVEHIQQHCKRPPHSLVMEDGLKIGNFSANLRFGAKLTEKQRQRLLDVDSTFFTIDRPSKKARR